MTAEDQKLSRGEVVVNQQDAGAVKYVVAKILIDAPPSQVWQIMTNPFEFKEKITPRMKKIEVLVDRESMSVLKVTVDPGFFLPPLTYAVESRYERDERIEFKRVGGSLKDFRGCWELAPRAGGSGTEVIYSMYVEPGIPCPQWIVRFGLRNELPKTLQAMRDRIEDVYRGHEPLVAQSILAAGINGPIAAAHGQHRL